MKSLFNLLVGILVGLEAIFLELPLGLTIVLWFFCILNIIVYAISNTIKDD